MEIIMIGLFGNQNEGISEPADNIIFVTFINFFRIYSIVVHLDPVPATSSVFDFRNYHNNQR